MQVQLFLEGFDAVIFLYFFHISVGSRGIGEEAKIASGRTGKANQSPGRENAEFISVLAKENEK